MENYRPTRRSLFVRRRVSMLVRFQTDQDDLWRRPGALHSERQLRQSETRWEHVAESGRTIHDGIVRRLELLFLLHRCEGDARTTKGLGSNSREDIGARRIKEDRDSLRPDHP